MMNNNIDAARSPVPQKVEAVRKMDFRDALAEVIGGHKVTKLEWNDSDVYLFMKDSTLMIHRNGNDHNLIVSEADIIGDDYIVTK